MVSQRLPVAAAWACRQAKRPVRRVARFTLPARCPLTALVAVLAAALRRRRQVAGTQAASPSAASVQCRLLPPAAARQRAAASPFDGPAPPTCAAAAAAAAAPLFPSPVANNSFAPIRQPSAAMHTITTFGTSFIFIIMIIHTSDTHQPHTPRGTHLYPRPLPCITSTLPRLAALLREHATVSAGRCVGDAAAPPARGWLRWSLHARSFAELARRVAPRHRAARCGRAPQS